MDGEAAKKGGRWRAGWKVERMKGEEGGVEGTEVREVCVGRQGSL